MAFIAIVTLQASVVLGGYYLDSDDWFVVSMGAWTEKWGLWEGLGIFWTEEPTWRPLLTLRSHLEWALFGLEPVGRYAMSLGLHALAALLVWAWVRLRRPQVAGLACLLYLVHPLHAEALAWFHSGFEGILVSVFGLAVLLAQGAPSRRVHRLRGGAGRVALMSIFLQLGLWSRESAAAVVPLVALLAFVEGERAGRFRRMVHDGLPLALLVLLNVGWRFVMLHLDAGRNPTGSFHVVESPMTAVAAVALHPWLPVHPGLAWREVYWALTGAVSLALLWMMVRRREARLAFGAFALLVLPFVPMFHEAGRFFEAAGGGHEQRWYFFHLALAPLCAGAAFAMGPVGESDGSRWRRLGAFAVVIGVFAGTQLANARWWRTESDVARGMAQTLIEAAKSSPTEHIVVKSTEGSDAAELADQVLLNFGRIDPSGRSGRAVYRLKQLEDEFTEDVVVPARLQEREPSLFPHWRRAKVPRGGRWFAVDEESRRLAPVAPR